MTAPDPVGLPVSAIATPALVLDLDAFERNVTRMAAETRALDVAWRPHAKAHGNPDLARIQVAAGAIGATCATVDEASTLVAGGITDILIANQVVTRRQADRVAALQRAGEVIVSVDSSIGADVLATAARRAGVRIPVVLEVDIGMGRAGVRDDVGLDGLAAHLRRAGGLTPRGLMGYEGHTLDLRPDETKRSAIERSVGRLLDARDRLARAGQSVEIVSCGGTGSFRVSGAIDGVTEVQAGGGCLYDRFYAEACAIDGFEYALTIHATVVSRPEPDLAIIDAGMKAVSIADGAPRPLIDGASVVDLFAEHGRLRLEGDACALAVGDRVTLVPGYSDSTTMLHRTLIGVRGGTVERLLPRPARETS